MSEPAGFQIRPVRDEDHQAVLKLSPRLAIGTPPWRDPAGVAAAARGWIESSLAAAREDGRAVLVALLDGRVAGVICLGERQHFTGEVDAYVGELITNEAFEGRGAGRALMAAAERWAAGRGLSRITLDTGARNHRARRFYEKVGFEEEEIRFSKAVKAIP
jgi:ribosomal protein S18 acetylase RimI-like enzyme